MDLVAVIAVAAALIFARLAMMQELNPFFWGTLAVVVYGGAPLYMIRRGAGFMEAPLVWLSSYVGLFLLFIAQSIVAERKRYKNRGGPIGKPKSKPRTPGKKKPGKRRE